MSSKGANGYQLVGGWAAGIMFVAAVVAIVLGMKALGII